MNFLDTIRRKTPTEKSRIMLVVAIVVAILLIIIWIISARYQRHVAPDDTLFNAVGQGVKNVQTNYGK